MRHYAVTRTRTRSMLRLLDVAGESRRHPPAAAGEVRRLLLVRLQRFGDVITMLPAVERARASFPAARITWMVSPLYAGFIESLRVVDEVWPVARWWEAWTARRRGFDLALEFHADVRAILAARRHARRVAGSGMRGGSFWLDVEMAAETGAARLSAAARHVRLVEAAAATSPHAIPRTITNATPRLRWPRRHRAHDYVLIHPGCGQRSKRWPISGWKQLVAHGQQRSYDMVLVGGPADVPLCRQLAAATGACDRSGGASWEALADWVADARGVVAPDTGILHLAQALGTPSVALFGPTDPEVWGYAEPMQHVLVHRLACSHCDRGVCPRVRGGEVSPCLQAITPQEAAAALDVLMNTAARGRGEWGPRLRPRESGARGAAALGPAPIVR